MVFLLLLALLFVPSGKAQAQSRPLDIYWIDVEGGAATLLVSPSGESFLIDTGWMVGDRDAKRVYAATQLAGLKKIDYLLISHFHADHVGGLAALSKMIPIGKFYDHGDTIEKENQQWLDSYTTASAGKRTIVKPGDEIPVKGLRMLVVASDEKVLAKPVHGAVALRLRQIAVQLGYLEAVGRNGARQAPGRDLGARENQDGRHLSVAQQVPQ